MGWIVSTPNYELWLDVYLVQILPEYEHLADNVDASLECTEILKDLNFVQKLRHLCDLLVLDQSISSSDPKHFTLCIMYLLLQYQDKYSLQGEQNQDQAFQSFLDMLDNQDSLVNQRMSQVVLKLLNEDFYSSEFRVKVGPIFKTLANYCWLFEGISLNKEEFTESNQD